MKKTFLKPFTFAIILLVIVSCGHDAQHRGLEFMPDMYRSPSYETYQISPFFKDSLSARLPVSGTVSRGHNTYFPYPNTNEGYESAGKELKNPFLPDKAMVNEGKRLFNIYCQHCHGEAGDGQGTLKIKGEKFPVPSYFRDDLINLPEGKMFFTITYGKNLMGPHATLVDPDQRWKIITYIKEMQANALAGKTNEKAAANDTLNAAAKNDTINAVE